MVEQGGKENLGGGANSIYARTATLFIRASLKEYKQKKNLFNRVFKIVIKLHLETSICIKNIG